MPDLACANTCSNCWRSYTRVLAILFGWDRSQTLGLRSTGTSTPGSTKYAGEGLRLFTDGSCAMLVGGYPVVGGDVFHDVAS